MFVKRQHLGAKLDHEIAGFGRAPEVRDEQPLMAPVRSGPAACLHRRARRLAQDVPVASTANLHDHILHT